MNIYFRLWIPISKNKIWFLSSVWGWFPGGWTVLCPWEHVSGSEQSPCAHCTPALRNKTHHHGAEQMHTRKWAAKPWQICFKKKKVCFLGVLWLFLCYPAYAALVNSQWVPSFKHIKCLGERLVLQESKNRPNVFCCERLCRDEVRQEFGFKRKERKKRINTVMEG